MPRPSVTIPQWATDILYNAPGKAWDTFVTKILPLAGKLAKGFEPSEQPPAEFLNHLLNAYGVHLDHLDAVDAQNWGLPVDASGTGVLPVAASPSMVYEPVTRVLWLVGGRAVYSRNGLTWTDSGAVFLDLGSVACSTGGVVLATTRTAGPGKVYHHIPADASLTWTTHNLANSTAFNGSGFDRWEDKFYWFGDSNTSHPAIWTSDNLVASIVSETLANAGSDTGTIQFMAVSPTLKLAFGTTAGFPSIFTDHAWSTDSFGNPWADLGPLWTTNGGPFDHPPTNLVYDESRGLFVVTCSGGEVYVSVDGQNWAQLRTLNPDYLVQVYTLAIYGGLYVAMVGDGNPSTPRDMVWSVDGARTWNFVAYPFDQGDAPASLAFVDGRFVIVNDAGVMSFSLRLK